MPRTRLRLWTEDGHKLTGQMLDGGKNMEGQIKSSLLSWFEMEMNKSVMSILADQCLYQQTVFQSYISQNNLRKIQFNYRAKIGK